MSELPPRSQDLTELLILYLEFKKSSKIFFTLVELTSFHLQVFHT